MPTTFRERWFGFVFRPAHTERGRLLAKHAEYSRVAGAWICLFMVQTSNGTCVVWVSKTTYDHTEAYDPVIVKYRISRFSSRIKGCRL